MTHCRKCGCLDNVGESVTCEACTDSHAIAVEAMKAPLNQIDSDTGKPRLFFHRDYVLMIIRELE